MLPGLKFIPRDHVDKEKDGTHNKSKNDNRRAKHRKEKGARKKYSSSNDDGVEQIKSWSRKNKKWYNSDEHVSSFSEQSETENDRRRHKRQERGKKRHGDHLDNEHETSPKKKEKNRRLDYSSESESSSDSKRERSSEEGNHHKRRISRHKEEESWATNGNMENDLINMAHDEGTQAQNKGNIVRVEMGLGWMLRSTGNMGEISNKSSHIEPEEALAEEMKDNPRELNPYLKNSGSGYPEDTDGMKDGEKQLFSNAVVGDGGASWRLKALKRAKEQAAREGRKLEEVVEERWGCMGHFAASVASCDVAPTHAHLRAIKSRRGLSKEEHENQDDENNSREKDIGKRSIKDIHPQHPKMKMPKFHDSLSWGKQGSKKLSAEDTALVSVAMSSLNKFSNDGSFMDKVSSKEDNCGDHKSSSKFDARAETKSVEFESGENKDVGSLKSAMSANQLAAKALQLKMKGKHEEAEKLMKEAENMKERQNIGNESSRPRLDGTTSRLIMHNVSTRQKNKDDDADLHLAQKIMHNHRYSVSNQADEEYDYDDGPRKKNQKKGKGGNHTSSQITNSANRFLTQQERCHFCFENPRRPKHLIVAIANFTYLSLPHQQPVVPGHCGILTLQHESSTRTVDDNVWDEIRIFKKFLIMMFGKKERDVVFIETVMGLAQQRRHCLVECIPLSRDIAKQAPVYFKKAIDEAEDEWSQHNAKKLIDTSEKGLRSSIPKNFPYFHVEFGLNRGFVHVIDDERDFKSSFGLNVIRGMLRLPAEDMHRHGRHESVEAQKQAVASFARDWEPFDWTKQLG